MKKISFALAALTLSALLTTVIPIGNTFIWFTSEIQLTTDTASDWSPAVTQDSNENIWIVWHTFRTGNGDLFCKINDGSAWSLPIQLTTDPSQDVNPAILRTNEGTIWLFWTSYRTGNYEVFCKTSQNNGLSWSSETQLTLNASADRRPSAIQAHNGDIWLVWHSDRTGNEELFYKVYSIADETWGDDVQLTFDPSSDRSASVMQAQNGTIWVFWGSYRTGDFDIFRKTYNGTSWSEETRLTTDKNWDLYPSSVQAKDGKIWLFWASDRKGTDYDIYYKFSTDNGLSWSADTQFTSDSSDDTLPSVFESVSKTLWVAWCSNRFGEDLDVFYRLASHEHDVAITDMTLSSIYVYRGYGITLTIEVRNCGLYSENFTVTAYHNNTAIGTQTVMDLAPDRKETLVFQWTAINVALGNYTISSELSGLITDEDLNDNSLTYGTISVRIPGDVNGDRTVNVLDAIPLSKYFGKHSEYPAADINGDGLINIYDAIILTTYFGETS